MVMNDKEIMDEFTKLYNDYGSIDKALYEIRKIISPRKYMRLICGLVGLRK